MAWRDWVRTVEIEPSLYAANFADLGAQLRELLDAGARVFHFDVGDGRFVEPVTMGPIVLESIAPMLHERGAVVDVHLMVADPARHVPQFARAGADSVTFHVEAVDDPEAVIALARAHGLQVGVACRPDTPTTTLAAAAQEADLALCMSVHPGYSGQRFIPETIPRMRELRDLLPQRVLLQADGGVGGDNVRAVHEAGATLMVAASAIFGGDDLARAYRRLVEALA